MDGSATATIIAAIIGAASAAAVAVGQTAATQSGSPVFGVVSNQSDCDFDIFSFAPYHGHTFETPDFALKGAQYVQQKFLDAVIGRYGVNYTQEDLAKEKADWIRDDIFKNYADDCAVKYGGTGDGMGFEQVILFYTAQMSKLAIALLVRKLPGGHYGAGVSMSDNGWYDWENDKPEGEKIMDHIKNVHTDLCQYSDGGSQISAQLGSIKVLISAPGEKIEVLIKNA